MSDWPGCDHEIHSFVWNGAVWRVQGEHSFGGTGKLIMRGERFGPMCARPLMTYGNKPASRHRRQFCIEPRRGDRYDQNDLGAQLPSCSSSGSVRADRLRWPTFDLDLCSTSTWLQATEHCIDQDVDKRVGYHPIFV